MVGGGLAHSEIGGSLVGRSWLIENVVAHGWEYYMNYREFGGSLVGLFWTIEKMVDYCWKGHGS